MDNLIYKDKNIANLEISAKRDLVADNEYMGKNLMDTDKHMKEEIYHKKMNERYNKFLRISGANNNTNNNQADIQNQKLSSKDKRRLKKQRMKHKKEILWENDVTVNSEEFNFLADAKIVQASRDKFRNTIYREYMKATDIRTEEEIPEGVKENLKISQRFWFDDVSKEELAIDGFPNRGRIERYISEYKFDNSILEMFKPEYIEHNYSKALKELNAIKGIAEYLDKFGTEDLKLKQQIKVEDVTALARNCEQLFKRSLNILGYAYEEDEASMSVNLHAQPKFNDRSVLAHPQAVSQKIINTINYETDMNNIELQLKHKFNNWNEEDFLKKISADKMAALNNINNLIRNGKSIMQSDFITAINRNYESKTRVIVYYEAQQDYLREEMTKVEEKDFIKRLQMEDKLIELDNTINELTGTCELIYSIINDTYAGKELSVEQKQYLYRNPFYRDGIQKDTEEILYVYNDVATGNAEEKITDKEELIKMVNDLNQKIKSDMNLYELVKYQKELFELSDYISKFDFSNLNSEEKLSFRKVSNNAIKARAAVLFIASKRMDYIKDSKFSIEQYMSEAEKNIISENGNKKITAESIEQYVSSQFSVANQNSASAFAEFVNDREQHTKLLTAIHEHNDSLKWNDDMNDVKFENNHPEFNRNMKKMSQYASELNVKYSEWKKELSNPDIGPEQKEALEKNIAYLEIYKKLYAQDYFLNGRKNEKYNGTSVAGDKIIRSIPAFNSIPEIANMSEEAIFQMAHNLSKGVFEEGNVSKEQEAAFKRENSLGLAVYKEKLLEHYKNLYRKYGLEWKSPEFYIRNYKEMLSDFTETQVHDKLRNDPANFELEDAEDRLLYELIAFYRPYIAAVDAGISSLKKANGVYTAGTIENMMHTQWYDKNVQIHLAYLKKHEGELV